ncbi:hypothetical protein [Pseudoalteromonas sp. MMG024]|uniref:hypothetical protein n=1 Tax=Pseudoalteromonas sp. MMG024 TaxID=2909980 RepID=UPI001F2445E0|nr:hypothetical protein [Pseudoalteromonas sp. MMG024]MCF6459094.1 hypothetical protein [Pseudoalteromonas sp. MMG024]
MAKAIVDLKLEIAVGIEGYALMKLDEKINQTFGFAPSDDLEFVLHDMHQIGIADWVKSNIDDIPEEAGIYSFHGRAEFTEDTADYSIVCMDI